jgi:hypothetical protein
MSRTPTTIARLIRLSMLAIAATGCGEEAEQAAPDSSTTPDDCGPQTSPFVVDDERLTSASFAELTDAIEQAGMSWAELDDAERCAVACVHAADSLVAYLDGSVELGECSLVVEFDGELFLTGAVACDGEVSFGTCLGRRPFAWDAPSAFDGMVDGTLARFVALEHASITAFIELGDQLSQHGASPALIDRCRWAAADERRHVELLVSLGAPRPGATLDASGAASLLAIALHNAVEGCVHETWAALLAADQAERAPDPRVRATFARIARDEAEHGQLAWDIHAWLATRLRPDQLVEVEAARVAALARLPALAAAQANEIPAATRSTLGLPDRSRARALAEVFAGALAAAA